MAERLRRLDDAVASHPVRAAALVVGWLLVVVLVGLDPTFDTGDDVTVQWILDGTYLGAPSAEVVLSNVIVGWVLAPLYRLLPEVPWFGLWLYGLQALALTSLAGVVASRPWFRASRHGLALVGALLCVAVPAWMHLQYTITAFLLVGAGAGVLAVHLPGAIAPRRAALWGAALLALGGMVRFNALRGAALLLLPLAVATAVRLRHDRPRLLAAALAVGLLVGGTWAIDEATHRGDAAYQDYLSFKRTHGWIHSTPKMRGNPPDGSLEAIGWNRNDWNLFRGYFFAGEDVYTTEDLKVLGEMMGSRTDPAGDVVDLVVEDDRLQLLVLAALTVAVAASARRPAESLATLGAVAWAAAVMVWVGATVRLPFRVSYGMVASLVLLVLARPFGDEERPGRLPALLWPALGAALVLAGLVQLGEQLEVSDRNARQASASADLIERLEDLGEDALIVELPGALPKAQLSPLDGGGFDLRIVPAGGWYARSPAVADRLAALGVDDVLLAAAQRDDVYAVYPSQFGLGGAFRSFVQDHRGVRLRLDELPDYSTSKVSVARVTVIDGG